MAFVLLTVVFFTDHYCAGYLISIVCCPFFISVLFRIVVTSGGGGGERERERGVLVLAGRFSVINRTIFVFFNFT